MNIRNLSFEKNYEHNLLQINSDNSNSTISQWMINESQLQERNCWSTCKKIPLSLLCRTACRRYYL